MNKYVSRGLLTVLFTGGLMAIGVGAANAADNTTGDDGTGSGTQAILGIQLPITISGNGISLLGDSSSTGASTTPPAAPAPSAATTGGSSSLLGGSQALLGVSVPITVSGNAVSVLGDSGSAASTTAPSPAPGFTGDTGEGTTGDGASTSGTDSILSGSQVLGAVSVPVTVGGNAISVAGDSNSDGSTVGRGFAGASSTNAAAPTTSGDSGIGSGTQVVPDVAAPVTVGGNAISVLGDASSTGASSSSGSAGSTGSAGDGSATAGSAAPTTSGLDSVLGGSQIAPDATAPVTASGDAVSVLGDATTSGSTTSGSGSGTGSTGAPTTSGASGIAGGSQVIPDVTAPVTASGDAVSMLGDATSTGATTGDTTGGSVGGVDTTSDGASTTGDGGILSGSQLAPIVRIPVTISGTAVSVTGDSTTTGTTTDPGQTGEVGGVETFAPTDATPGTISTAALSEQSLASTGVTVLPGLLAALALLLAGAAMRVRVVLARR